jgi:hypothetical protein
VNIPAPPSWPGLASTRVLVGGVTCTVTEACTAAEVLQSSKSSAIRSLLTAAGNPLGTCDYWAAAGPYLAAARSAIPATHRRGCAGRHVAKTAFCDALCTAVEQARKSFWAAAMSAFSADERYAAAIAEEAVSVRRRRHARVARDQLRQAADAAMAMCRAAAGEFSCANPAACGTGSCRFADARFTTLTMPAPSGRRARPVNHTGGTYSESVALAAWLERHPYKPAITVRDADACHVADREAA